MKIKNLFVAVLAAVVGFPPAAVRFVKNIGRQTVLACNAFTPSVHRNSITKFTSAAITTRYLLGKFDSANLTNGVAVAGLGDRAFFVIADTAATATDLALTTPAPVNCLMLDSINETVPMVAAGAIAVGTVVYPVANGQVNSYVGLGSTGTNYPCGVVVANASAQAGDILEVMPTLGIASATV